jgi:hypothetical protein
MLVQIDYLIDMYIHVLSPVFLCWLVLSIARWSRCFHFSQQQFFTFFSHCCAVDYPLIMRSFIYLLAVGLPLVSAHCKISNAVGDLGGKAVAFGISGNKADSNSQKDVTKFSNGNTFGATQAGGAINPAKDISAVQAISGNTLPQVSAGGQLTMTLHQVNVREPSDLPGGISVANYSMTG